MAKTTLNAHLVAEPGADIQETVQLHIDNLGGVAAVSTADAAAAAGSSPTKEEFDKVVALANSLKKQHNALVAALKA